MTFGQFCASQLARKLADDRPSIAIKEDYPKIIDKNINGELKMLNKH